MKKLGVIGIGSAGVLSLSYFIANLDKDWQVVSIHDPNTPILGIGESTNPTFVEVLQNAFAFNLIDDLEELESTVKFSTKWINWREHSFYTPLLGGAVAVHFNNRKLKDFAFPRLKQYWKEKFQVLEGKVESVTNNNNHVDVVVDGELHEFDYILDCTGFPKDYNEDYQVMDYMPTNRAIVHSKHVPADWGYTGHRATKNGWMFEIPLTTRQTFGYLFNDTITSKEEAQEDFSKEIGVPVSELDSIDYKYKAFYTKKLVDGRIMKNGNKAIFIDPLSATSIYAYDKINKVLLNFMKHTGSTAKANEHTNLEFIDITKGIELLISYFYHGGSIYDTPFWKRAKENTAAVVNNSPQMAKAIKNFDHWNSRGHTNQAMPQFFFPANLSLELDGPRGFAYNYFNNDRT